MQLQHLGHLRRVDIAIGQYSVSCLTMVLLQPSIFELEKTQLMLFGTRQALDSLMDFRITLRVTC